jgi:hypothetical protein
MIREGLLGGVVNFSAPDWVRQGATFFPIGHRLLLVHDGPLFGVVRGIRFVLLLMLVVLLRFC